MLIKKHLNLKFSLASFSAKPLLSSVIMGVVVYLFYFSCSKLSMMFNFGSVITYVLNLIFVVVSVALGGAIYFGLMAKIGGFTKSDIDSIPQKFRKLIPSFFTNLIK
jgi:stage V sporulation protein B